MPTYTVNESSLSAVADAIRQKGGTSAQLVFPSGFIEAIRNIHTAGVYQNKTGITPTESSQTITPDTGYDALTSVQINAISNDYVGSGITRRTSSDLTASGATVTAPAGYYGASASKSIASGSVAVPNTSITADPSISIDASGLITATASATKSVSPTVSAGYVSSGTSGSMTVSGFNTSQLSTQAAKTVTPTENSQVAVASGKYTIGDVTVDPIPSQYIVPSGNLALTANGTNINVSEYATVSVNVPGTTGITIIDEIDQNGGTIRHINGTVISGTKSITQNGSGIDVTSYASVDVNVPSNTPKRVYFVDYDGAVLYSYTIAEINSLTDLPLNPSRSGLTAQGWNWTLAEIKSELEASPTDDIYVGQMYTTIDGNTRLYCHFQEGRTRPCIYLAVNGSVNLRFGDGTYTTIEGTSITSLKGTYHTYSAAGDYVITIEPTEGSEFLIGGNSTNHSTILLAGSASTSSGEMSDIYRQSLRKVECGANMRISSYAFYGCTNLETVIAPPSTNSPAINSYAYYNCNSLKMFVVPNTYTAIGSNAFRLCRGLKNVSVSPTVTSIGNYAFYNCIKLYHCKLPSSVMSLGSYAFMDCYDLKYIEVPASGITTIPESCFAYCESLESVKLPSSIRTISNLSFRGCYSLRDFEFPSSLVIIGDSAFQANYVLQSIDLPSSVTTIGSNAFYSCYGATILTLPSGLESIGNSAFTDCACISAVSIPSSVETIGTSVFSGCLGLSTVSLPNALSAIETSMFETCYALTGVTLPSGTTEIKASAFKKARGMNKITIPAGVTSIESEAFADCYGMREYHILATAPPTLGGSDAFTNIQSDCVIYVPASQDQSILNAYQTATNWSTYASYMQEETS